LRELVTCFTPVPEKQQAVCKIIHYLLEAVVLSENLPVNQQSGLHKSRPLARLTRYQDAAAHTDYYLPQQLVHGWRGG